MFDRAPDCFVDQSDGALPVHAARPESLPVLLGALPADQAAYLRGCGFKAEAGRVVLLPGQAGLGGAVLGLGEETGPYVWGALPAVLPALQWRLGEGVEDVATAVLGWALGAYRFVSLKSAPAESRSLLVLPEGQERTVAQARAVWLVRDLVNTPANLLGPAELAACAQDVLAKRGVNMKVIEGAAVAKAYPALQAVGCGSSRPPCVVIGEWRSATASTDAKLVSICGKGVCFDTGGYDIKSSAGMLRMKKDMGGAAIALAVACLVIDAGLPVRLELRLGCVDNMISGHAMRPSDVLHTRAGLSVEVGNTDAEGRLVLCDLIAEACLAAPDLLLDYATLTGAARVALGPDLPAMFSNDDVVASLFAESATAVHDPVWRMPLWQGYNSWLESTVADINNVSKEAHSGAIVAAMFLQRFVSKGTRWAHFDVYAWNDVSRAGRPSGGEAQALRATGEAITRFVSLADQQPGHGPVTGLT